MRLRRRNLAWLTVLGALVLIAVLSGVAAPAVTAVLLSLYFLALAASILDFQPEQLIDRSRSSLTSMRMSSEAREAVERARRRGSYLGSGLTLLDIGLITSQSNRDGMVMRKTRSTSLDDDGVRPFVTLHVQPEQADQNAVIRFEIVDASGQSQYVHEMRTYLRDGEMNILADHHLPLASNSKLESGDWDLRVTIDGVLHGLHNFTLAPSLNDRYRRIERAQAEEERAERLTDAKEEEPLSLEELLRSRSRQDREG